MTKERVRIKHKWVQGSQVILRCLMTYGKETKDITMSMPISIIKNKEQFKAMLEEGWEANKPRTEVDLSSIPDSI